MTLRIRHLRLRAETGVGAFGADIAFTLGLNILWADNTMGKSTAMQAILYALGLERMLSARRELPLTYVMTSHLFDADTGLDQKVLQSSVTLELANGDGKVISVRRSVIGGDRRLVSVYDGPVLSEAQNSFSQSDYFVLDPGAAQREAGFHRYLADFLGWQLPTVRRFDGSETPLYLETIFPLVYVEQKSGWSAIPAAFPTYLQIRDVSKRAVEFLLGMDTHETELRRQQIEIDLAELRSAWVGKRNQLASAARTLNARVTGLSAAPTLSEEEVRSVSVEVQHDADWISLSAAIQALVTRIATLQDVNLPTVGAMTPVANARLESALRALEELNAKRARLQRQYRIDSSQLASAERRIVALEEDLQKNLDVLKLRRLGSTVAGRALVPEHCPTCDQPIEDTLLPQSGLGQVMPIEDNVEYVRTQLGMFRQVVVQSESALAETATELQRVNADVREANVALRALRADLATPDSAPSAAAIAERLQAEYRLSALTGFGEMLEGERQALLDLSAQARKLSQERADLPSNRFTDEDRDKLARFSDLVRTQAQEYGFSTFSPTELSISPDTYRPEKEGFEIGFQLSASDAIRLKWAYQLSLLELGRSSATNHPGFVIFDEPRQQEARQMSFQRLLEHASSSGPAGEQVIFATSEDMDRLRVYLSNLECNLIAFNGKLVRKLDSSG